MKKVIDGDRQVVIDSFYPEDSKITKEKYENIENWEEVEFDSDGDLILYKKI